MTLVPNDADELMFLRQIRQEIAQDRTDIQRLMKIMQQTQFLEFPTPEVGEYEESSSSSSEEVSLEDLTTCSEIPTTIFITLSRIAGSYISTNSTSQAMNQMLGTHTMTKIGATWRTSCNLLSPLIAGGWIRWRIAMTCASTPVSLNLTCFSHETPGCTDSGGPGTTVVDADFSETFKNPFYAVADFSYVPTSEVFQVEITE